MNSSKSRIILDAHRNVAEDFSGGVKDLLILEHVKDFIFEHLEN
ncbi:MAG TPA: hypothetical protein VJK03_05455 [Candidatus Nanoarchaeia archaeon]|nr:hypothetical protein [Candidatus Nanoarchaeia archaeon]